MATVFWDSQGVIYIDYLEKGKTVTGLYYAKLLGRFSAELQKIRPHLAKKKVLFHHDNAPAHTSALANAKLFELGYELLPHPSYSPDLAAQQKKSEITLWLLIRSLTRPYVTNA